MSLREVQRRRTRGITGGQEFFEAVYCMNLKPAPPRPKSFPYNMYIPRYALPELI